MLWFVAAHQFMDPKSSPWTSLSSAVCLIRELDLKHALHYLRYSTLHVGCDRKFLLSGCISDLVRTIMPKLNIENLKLGFVEKSYAE